MEQEELLFKDIKELWDTFLDYKNKGNIENYIGLELVEQKYKKFYEELELNYNEEDGKLFVVSFLRDLTEINN